MGNPSLSSMKEAGEKKERTNQSVEADLSKLKSEILKVESESVFSDPLYTMLKYVNSVLWDCESLIRSDI